MIIPTQHTNGIEPHAVVAPSDALSVSAVSIDGGTQTRDRLNDDVISDYAEAIGSGATFPPVVVYYDGDRYWLADGFHRFHACRKLGREHISLWSYRRLGRSPRARNRARRGRGW